MKKRITIAVLLLLILLPCAVVLWLSYTAAGLQFALNQLNHVPGVKVTINGVSGTLARALHIDYFELDHERIHIIAKQIDIDLNPTLLVSGIVSINSLKISDAEATLKRGKPGPETVPPHFLPSFLRINADALNIDHARFVSYNGFTLDGTPVSAQLSLTRSLLRLKQLDIRTSWLDVQGAFELRSALQLELGADVLATLKPGRSTPLQGKVNMSGTAKLMKFAVDLQQPQTAHVNAALDLSQGWLLNGDLTASRWQLSPWLENAPFSFGDAQLQFSMNDAGIHLVGDLVVPEWQTPTMHLDARGKYAARVITLEQADISANQGAIATSSAGTITLNESGQPTLDLHGNWRGLQWPLRANRDNAYFYSSMGNASLKGSSPYRFSTDAQLSLPIVARNVPQTSAVANNSHITASGVLTPQLVLLERYQWQVLNGTAAGSGQLQFALPRAWKFAVNASNLNTGLINNEFAGQLNLTATVSGQNFTPKSPFDLQLQSLNGTLRKQSIHAQGHVAHAQQTWRADAVSVNWGAASLRASGTVGPQNNLRLDLNAPQLQQLYSDLNGDFQLSGQVMGETDKPRLNVVAQSKHMDFKDLDLDGLALNAQVDLTDRSPSNLQLKAQQLSLGDYNLQQPQFTGSGQASAHELKFTTSINLPQLKGPLQFATAVNGAYSDKQWRATLKQVQVIDSDKRERVSLTQDANVVAATTQASLQSFCLNVDSGKLCANGEWHAAMMWQAQATLDNLPLDLSNTAWAQDAHIRSNVNARANFRGTNTQDWIGSANVALSDASIRYQMVSGKEQLLPINVGEVHLDADARTIRSTAEIAIGSDTRASMNSTVDRTVSGDWHQWALSGGAQFSSADAKLIPVFVSEVDRAAGTLTSNLRFGGTLGSPLLSGNMQLRQGELDFYQTNLALRGLQFDADLNNDQLQFTAQGNAGEGMMNASGNLSWRNNELYGNLQLKGDKLLVADLPEYHVLASPDLSFEIAKHNVNVKGEVLIPSARLQPKDISGAVQTSADARFKTDKVFERSSSWTIASDVTIRLGDDVQFDGLGLQGKLGGNVTTNIRTANTATGRGELNVNDGVYEAYGRKLDIKRGRLIFDATPLDNPGLDIQAERKIEDTIVGVYVRGQLRDPRLQFYSDPTMSQSEIVSYLIVGKPLDQLQSGEATSVRSATNSLALQGGGYLAAQLGRRVGLEEVGLETDTNNQQSFVLGKFLSPRLFVSYGISLTEAINTLKLRYTLSDHWLIRTEAGEAKSADVEFRVNR